MTPYSASTRAAVTDAGWFHLYDTSVAESGAGQMNESVYFRVTNGSDGPGLPLDSNCDGECIVADPDNARDQPAGSRVYRGTFWFDAGTNIVDCTPTVSATERASATHSMTPRTTTVPASRTARAPLTSSERPCA